MLIRDAAYDSTPKELRGELHERYADWLEAKAGGRIREYEEILGFHLEQACRYRRELTPLDEQAAALGRRAAAWLSSAGRRALARGDATAAIALLSRALALLPEGDRNRLPLMPNLGEALGMRGDWEGAVTLLDEVVTLAEAAGDRRTRSYAVLSRSMARMHVRSTIHGRATRRRGQGGAAGFRGARRRGRPRARLERPRAATSAVAATIRRPSRRMSERSHARHQPETSASRLIARAHIGTSLFHGPEPLDDVRVVRGVAAGRRDCTRSWSAGAAWSRLRDARSVREGP